MLCTSFSRLVVTGRSGVKTGYQKRCLYLWKQRGVDVLVSSLDIAHKNQSFQLIAKCQEMGPLGGIFHLAMVLRDSLFENQTVKSFQEVAAPKYWGTKHLDEASRQLCGQELQW